MLETKALGLMFVVKSRLYNIYHSVLYCDKKYSVCFYDVVYTACEHHQLVIHLHIACGYFCAQGYHLKFGVIAV